MKIKPKRVNYKLKIKTKYELNKTKNFTKKKYCLNNNANLINYNCDEKHLYYCIEL